MEYFVKSLDNGCVYVYSNSKKKSINEDIGNDIFTYDDFLDTIFYHNDTCMIGKVDYSNGVISIEYYDFNEDSYTTYTNKFYLNGGGEDLFEYCDFLNNVKSITDYYKKNEGIRLIIIEEKIKSIKERVFNRLSSLKMSESYMYGDTIDVSDKEEVLKIYDYINEHKQEIIDELSIYCRSTGVNLSLNIFSLIRVLSIASCGYALSNPKYGLGMVLGGMIASIEGTKITNSHNKNEIRRDLEEMLYEIRNIYDCDINKSLVLDRIVSNIKRDIEFINNHKNRVYNNELNDLLELSSQYKRELKAKLEEGVEVNTNSYAVKLGDIENKLYFKYVKTIDESENGINDIYLNMVYKEIRDIYNNPYDGYLSDINDFLSIALEYQIYNNLENVKCNSEEILVEKIVILKKIVDEKRNNKDIDSSIKR